MVCKRAEHFNRRVYWKALMHNIMETYFRLQPNHSLGVMVTIIFSLKVIIVPQDIGRHIIVVAFAAVKEIYNRRHVVEPLVGVNKHEPLTLRGVNACVARG